MALLTDGLWISEIELDISRFDAPIPENMKNIPIKMQLTLTQIRAIAAVLGLGLENGNVVCYNDQDLDHFMKDPKNSLIENKYKLMTAEEISKRRIAAKAFEPLVKNKNISDIWDKEGFIEEDMPSMKEDSSKANEPHINIDDIFDDMPIQ